MHFLIALGYAALICLWVFFLLNTKESVSQPAIGLSSVVALSFYLIFGLKCFYQKSYCMQIRFLSLISSTYASTVALSCNPRKGKEKKQTTIHVAFHIMMALSLMLLLLLLLLLSRRLLISAATAAAGPLIKTPATMLPNTDDSDIASKAHSAAEMLRCRAEQRSCCCCCLRANCSCCYALVFCRRSQLT